MCWNVNILNQRLACAWNTFNEIRRNSGSILKGDCKENGLRSINMYEEQLACIGAEYFILVSIMTKRNI